MVRLAFFGLGQMGRPMARNLAARFPGAVTAFDPFEAGRVAAAAAGVATAETAAATAAGADIAVLALPAAPQIRAALEGADGLLSTLAPGALIIDCSTIDPESARAFAAAAAAANKTYLDSPMSGGVAGAEAGRLTFMVGGAEADVARARPALEAMGANIFHAGPSGAGAAAKLCNNMLLAISMIGVGEAIAMAEKLGLSAESFHRISSTATGRCWSLNDYCPAPGPVPSAPSNRDYQPGFSTDLMLKDLKLAMAAAQGAGANTPLGAHAAQLYALLAASGAGGRDFSYIYQFLKGAGRDEA